MDHDSRLPGRPALRAKELRSEPGLPFATRLDLRRAEPGTLDLRGTSVLGAEARLRMPPRRLLELAELAGSWLDSRRRWAGYRLSASGPLRFPPAVSSPEGPGGDLRAFGERAATHHFIPCFGETILGWEVSGALVSGHDEAVGALVSGPGTSMTLLSRGALVLLPRPPEDPALVTLASACLVRAPCELARFRLAGLRRSSLVLEPGHVAVLEGVAGEFSSLRRIGRQPAHPRA